MSQARKGVQKKNDDVQNFHNIWYIWRGCQQMGRQTMVVPLCMCNGFPTKLMKQMIVTSLYDITRISHVIEGGKYKRRV